MKLPCYPRYVTSRDPWVGSVPAHWKMLRADFTTASNKEQISDTAMEGIEVLHYSIPNVQEFGTAQVEDGNDIDSSKLQINTAQLLISKLNPRKATLCIAEPDKKLLTVCSGEFVPIIPEGELTLRYCYYTWLSDKVTKMLSSRVQSVTRSHQRVSPEDITRLPWAWPPADEQKHIAAFLDWKTGQIDALIARKKELLEKLKEKRIAVITQAVTQGLNPAAPMRDSGIPWLGQVPQHWKVPALKFRYNVELGKMLDEKRITGEHPVSYLRNVDVQWDKINYEDLPVMDITQDEYPRYTIKENDVLVCEGGEVGRSAVARAQEDVIGFQKAIHRLRAEVGDELPKFIYYTLLWAVNTGVFSVEGASTIAHLTADQLRRYRFPRPPRSEQVEIVANLDERVGQIKKMIKKVESAIDRLTEYRTALVTAATTGKIDVRNIKVSTQG